MSASWQVGRVQRACLVAVTLVGVVGAFAPWWHFPVFGPGRAGVEEYSALLALFVGCAVAALVAGDRSSPLASGYCVVLALGAAAGGLWLIYNVGDYWEQMERLSRTFVSGGVSQERYWSGTGVGIGVYLEGAACVAIFLCCALFPRAKK